MTFQQQNEKINSREDKKVYSNFVWFSYKTMKHCKN